MLFVFVDGMREAGRKAGGIGFFSAAIQESGDLETEPSEIGPSKEETGAFLETLPRTLIMNRYGDREHYGRIEERTDANPAGPDMHDLGVLASTGPAALDQACIDLIYVQKDGDGASLVNRIESQNDLRTLEYAEEIGLGSRTYDLVDIDD